MNSHGTALRAHGGQADKLGLAPQIVPNVVIEKK